MYAASESRAVQMGAVSVLILRHIIGSFRVVFVDTLFHFFLSKGEYIGAAVRPT